MPSKGCGLSTFRQKPSSGRKWWSVPFFVTVVWVTGCSTPSTQPCAALQLPKDPPILTQIACPPALPPLVDDSMGSLANALVEAAETYHACRAAALGGHR